MSDRLHLPEDDARRLLLARAVESEDAHDALLTADDRRHATDIARAGAGDDADYLRLRSDALLARLLPRQPAIARAQLAARWPGFVDWLLPAAALGLGLASPLVDGDRMNLVFVPLILMIGWNLIVYALLLAGGLRALLPFRPARPPGMLARLPGRLIARAGTAGGAAGVALRRFADDWVRWSAPLGFSRASRTLHLAAALLALGALATLYAMAFANVDYRAGWASTFQASAPAIHALLTALLGLPAALTGIALPTVDGLDAMRWRANPGGVNAAPWIHLWTTAALLFIIAPRLLLAGWHAARAARLRRRFAVPGHEDLYVRRLLRERRGGGGKVVALPYSLTLSDRAAQTLRRLLGGALGAGTSVELLPTLGYGAEEAWLADRVPADADHLVLLFALSATPEAETHGALAAGLKARCGGALAVLLDESGYARRFGDQAGAVGGAVGGARVESRRAAWRALLAPHGLTPVSIDLEAERAEPRALEAALLRGGIAA